MVTLRMAGLSPMLALIEGVVMLMVALNLTVPLVALLMSTIAGGMEQGLTEKTKESLLEMTLQLMALQRGGGELEHINVLATAPVAMAASWGMRSQVVTRPLPGGLQVERLRGTSM